MLLYRTTAIRRLVPRIWRRYVATNTPSGYKASTSPSAIPISKIMRLLGLFPLSVKESFHDYRRRKLLDQVQSELLSIIPYYSKPSSTHSAEVVHTVVQEDTQEYINEFHIKPTAPAGKHVVFIHGYGAGLGFFVKNLEAIAEAKPDWDVHAIDMPGYGCSSRPDFPHKIPYRDYEKVESWFCTRMAAWFEKRSLNRENCIIVAHSMGAYLSCVLNFDRPELFGRMVLVSPAGVFHSRAKEVEAAAPAWFQKLWNRNYSPFSLVRNAGPWGSKIVSGWTSRRFSKQSSNLTPEEQKLMHMYTYAIFNAKGSGEYMLNYLLATGGVPRHPLLDRIENLHCPSTWMYGSYDWMDKLGGLKACQVLRDRSKDASFRVVNNAGHHIYLDGFDEFNRIVLEEMEKL